MGPIGGEKEDDGFSVNFTRSTNYQHIERFEDQDRKRDVLMHRLERLWNHDFQDLNSSEKVSNSVEDERALRVMEKSAKLVNGHYQVALPWRREPPDIPNNKIIAECRLRSLKNRLKKDDNMFERYTKAVQEYIDKGHAQKVPKEERDRDDGKVWYLPHHPVIHPAKPEKTRIVFDCPAKFDGQSLNDHLLSGPDLTNSLLGVLVRFRQGSIAMIADIESMFYQVLVQPDDWDTFRFLW